MTNGHRKSKILTTIVIAVCVAVLAVCGYKLFTYFYDAHVSQEEFDKLKPQAEEKDASYEDKLPGYQALKAENADFMGWLEIKDTKIDYPVMQTPNDLEYYLHRNFEKVWSSAGSLFASDISDIDTPSDLVLIYGHKMKSGAMFGQIGKYSDREFFDEHRKVIFDTLICRNEYKVISLVKTDVDTGSDLEFRYYNYSNFADEADFEAFMNQIRAKELVGSGDKPVFGDKLLLLSTCDNTTETGRLLLLAVRTSGKTLTKR
jgi:sortase B